MKDKIHDFSQNEYVKTVIAKSIFTAKVLIVTAIALKIITTFFLKDASLTTKKCITDLAKKLNFKNPGKINVKVLPTFLFGAKSLLGPNAVALLTGDIAISKNFDDDPLSNESKFIFGHELTHIKYKHPLKISIVSNILLTMITQTCLYLNNKYDILKRIPFLNKICENIKLSNKEKLYLNFMKEFYIFPSIASRVLRCEAQADLEAASLGKDLAEGGIKFFSNMYNKMSTFTKIASKAKSLLLMASHPTFPTRIEYLKNELAKQ